MGKRGAIIGILYVNVKVLGYGHVLGQCKTRRLTVKFALRIFLVSPIIL